MQIFLNVVSAFENHTSKENAECTNFYNTPWFDYSGSMPLTDGFELEEKPYRPSPLAPDVEYIPEDPILEESPAPVEKNNLSKVAHENDYDKLIIKYANEEGVEPALVKAFIRKESNFDKNATSKSSTAKGLMQLLKATAAQYGVKNPYDPEQIIRGGVRLIRDKLDEFGGDIAKAALAYYQGSGGARSLLRQGKTDKDGYVAKVISYYNEYKKCFTNT